MTQQPHTQPMHDQSDPDFHKGAVEGEADGPGNASAPALDEGGLPADEVAIAQDVIGANEDQTQG